MRVKSKRRYGSRGARDEKELDRRETIRKAFYRALAAKDTPGFWKIMRDAGIPDDSELAVKLYGQWRERIGEVWTRKQPDASSGAAAQEPADET